MLTTLAGPPNDDEYDDKLYIPMYVLILFLYKTYILSCGFVNLFLKRYE